MHHKSVPLVLGILLLIGAAFFLVAAIGLAVGTSTTPADPGVAAVSAVCTAILAIPGAVLLVLYRQWTRKDSQVRTVVAILASVREISIAEVAQGIQATPAQTIVLVSDAIASGQVHGYVDPQAGKFITIASGTSRPPFLAPPIAPPVAPPATPPAPAPQVPPIVPRFCRECGSLLERVPGQTGYACPNCGHVEPG